MQHPESEKLLKIVAESCTVMNRDGKFSKERPAFLDLFLAFLGDEHGTIIDYGCGARGGITKLVPPGNLDCVGYDPYVTEYSIPPAVAIGAPYAAIYCTDVLEHMTVAQVVDFLSAVLIYRPRLLFLVIATRPATKTLTNGVNAHLIVEPAAWWYGFVQGKLFPAYCCVMAWGDLLEDICVLAFRLNSSDGLFPETKS